MACPFPISIRAPDGYTTPDGAPHTAIIVPCGQCKACLERKRAEWTIRLSQEAKDHIFASFITLTYAEEYLPYVIDDENCIYSPTVVKKHLQDFIKRLRNYSQNKLRYYAIGEYGSKRSRPHYHLLLFGLDYLDNFEIIQKCWKYGIADVGKVEPASIHYVTKYHVIRKHHPPDSAPPFALMSRKPGLGLSYLNSGNIRRLSTFDNNTINYQGFKYPLPRYYADKLYNSENGYDAHYKSYKFKIQRQIEHDTIQQRKKILGDDLATDFTEFDKKLAQTQVTENKRYYQQTLKKSKL